MIVLFGVGVVYPVYVHACRCIGLHHCMSVLEYAHMYECMYACLSAQMDADMQPCRYDCMSLSCIPFTMRIPLEQNCCTLVCLLLLHGVGRGAWGGAGPNRSEWATAVAAAGPEGWGRPNRNGPPRPPPCGPGPSAESPITSMEFSWNT